MISERLKGVYKNQRLGGGPEKPEAGLNSNYREIKEAAGEKQVGFFLGLRIKTCKESLVKGIYDFCILGGVKIL